MAVTTTWRIEVGYYDNGTTFTTTDFTSRTLGLTVDHFTDLGVIGTKPRMPKSEKPGG